MKLIFAMLALAVAGTAAAAPDATPAVPAGHPDMSSPAGMAMENKGEVLEVIETAMYTYIQVQANDKPLWLAASRLKVAKGETLAYSTGPVMSNFHSKTLDRDFAAIMFVDKAEVAK